jgi:uncharacterized membrane protein YqjE
MEEIRAMSPEHVVTVAVPAVAVVAIARLIAYAIDDAGRWKRFRNLALFTVFLALAVAAGWWLLADGGVQVTIHDFGATPGSGLG